MCFSNYPATTNAVISERSFSTARRLKTWLHSSMNQIIIRFNNLATLMIHMLQLILVWTRWCCGIFNWGVTLNGLYGQGCCKIRCTCILYEMSSSNTAVMARKTEIEFRQAVCRVSCDKRADLMLATMETLQSD